MSRTTSERTTIDRLEFDGNRTVRSNASRNTHQSLLDDDVSFMNEVAGGIIERDRMRMRREVTRTLSCVCALIGCLSAGSITIFSLYGPRFLTDLHYSQYQVNAISSMAMISLYLLVPAYGYLCDRYSPRILSFLSAVLFGAGYLLAAFTYRSGSPSNTHKVGNGWPFGVMIAAFICIGSATSCMYLCTVATCAKNYATSKNRGFMLVLPIAAFGLSGVWQSQVAQHLLAERLPDGRKGDVDVFKFFVFEAVLLTIVGLLGTVGLRIVDEEDLIEHAVEEIERSGLLEESEFFRQDVTRTYGTTNSETTTDVDSDDELQLSESLILKKREEEALLSQKKTWLLNHNTRVFLSDRTMWLLAAGFFFITGPGEAYINNFGTIIPTLTPPKYFDVSSPPAGLASTHVSIIAISSTFARLLTGTISDLFAPSSQPSDEPATRTSFSRLTLLLPSATLVLLAFLNLSLPFLTYSTPPLFLLTSALVGLGYGASFSLVPVIISVVWGVENFATNWGIVAMMPAPGAALWSIVYSVGYSRAADHSKPDQDGTCQGYDCFGWWAWSCAASVVASMVLWILAWRAWKRRNVIV